MSAFERVVFNYQEIYTETLLAVFFVALLWIWMTDSEKEYRGRIVYPSLLLLFAMLNPLFMKYLWVPMFYGENELYALSRMYGFLPVLFVIAYYFTNLLLAAKGKQKKAGVFVGMLLILILTSNSAFLDSDLKPRENRYELPQAVIEVSDRLMLEYDQVKVMVPDEIRRYFRQYSTDIKVYNFRGGHDPGAYEVEHQLRQQWPDIGMVCDYAKQAKVDVILFNTQWHGFDSSPADYGYDFYDNIGTYDLYRRAGQ